MQTAETDNPIGYRNYYYDSETGLYYLKARYYDPTTGQFTQEDTVQDDNLQYNLYGYCSANPVLCVDPTGHKIRVMNSLRKGESYMGRVRKALAKISGYELNFKYYKPWFAYNYYEVKYGKKKYSKRTEGSKLIKALIDSKREYYIKYTSKNSHWYETGSNDINVNPWYKPNLYTLISNKNNPTRVSTKKKTPFYFCLAHELVHAYLDQKGIVWGNNQKDKNIYIRLNLKTGVQTKVTERPPCNELAAMGVGGYDYGEPSENKIRAEHNWLLRSGYYN